MSEDTDFKVATDQEAKLSETITHSAVRRKKKSLDVQPVVIVDADTGELLGAANFFPVIQPVDHRLLTLVQNVYQTAFEASNVRVSQFALRMNIADETIQVRITINGTVYTGAAANAVAGSTYYTYLNASSTALIVERTAAGATANKIWGLYESGDFVTILIEIRKTTAAGANTIDVCTNWSQH